MGPISNMQLKVLMKLRSMQPQVLLQLRDVLRLGLIKVPQYNHLDVRDFIVKHAYAVNDSYKKFTGIDELDRYQARVTSLQDQLLTAQEKRRQIGYQLSDLRKQSNELQDELQKTQRQENLQKFLDLMRDETEVLKREKVVNQQFQEQDRLEREIFTAFTNAIRDSQERQRTRLEYAKYWGLLIGVIGSLASYIITSMRTQDLKKLVTNEMRACSAPLLEGMRGNGRKLDYVYDHVSGQRKVSRVEYYSDVNTGVWSSVKRYFSSISNDPNNINSLTSDQIMQIGIAEAIVERQTQLAAAIVVTVLCGVFVITAISKAM